MSKSIYYLISLLILLNASCFNEREMSISRLYHDIEMGFINPPDTIQTSVYWYWISDNISKDAAVRDLHAMKNAGINRAFIGNIGIEDLPYGDVKI